MSEALMSTYEVTLSNGRVVRFRELSAVEFDKAIKMAGGADKAWELVNTGLRLSIVSDNGESLTYAQLTGPLMGQRFGTKDLLLLRAAWEAVHVPSQEEIEAAKNGVRVSV